MQIKMIIFDIDGVITDGKLTVDSKGCEYKTMDFRDIDAVFALKRSGYKIAFVTGEDTEITQYFNTTFQPDYFYPGNKDKANAVMEISELSGIRPDEICYIGDGKYDVAPMELVGVSACPKNAIEPVKRVAKVHLRLKGGNGSIHELVNLLSNYQEEDFSRIEKESIHFKNDIGEGETELRKESNNSREAIENDFHAVMQEHYQLVASVMDSSEIRKSIEIMVSKIIECYNRRGRILVFGNGGSAADSQHFAAELVGRFFLERPALSCEALTTNTSILTAVANDYGFERIFSRQVEAKAQSGDLLIGFTTSGKSPDVIEGFREGKRLGTYNIAMIGEESNPKLEGYCDLILSIPSSSTPRIQELHMLINHMVCEMVEHRLFG